MYNKEHFCARFREARKAAGKNTRQLAEELGVKPNTVSQWQTGVREPSFSTLCRLAESLQVTTDYLLGRAEGETPVPGLDPRCFHTDVTLHFYECDRNKKARIETILRLMADIAGVAYAAKGYTHSWLWERHFVFLVTRAAIRIRRMPSADETITVETWEVGVKGAQYYRSFRFFDRAGNIIIEGQTAWVAVDPETRVIQKPSAFPGTYDRITDKPSDTLPPARIKPEGELHPAGERTIVYSDIDGNGHTYNARYAGFASDVLPPALWEKELTDFRINFKQEVRLGETLSLEMSANESGATVFGQFGEVPSFEAEFLFR